MTNDERQHLREYLLGTLEPQARAELDARLVQDAALRDSLAREEAALARLDTLPEETPRANLEERVLAKALADRRRQIPWLELLGSAAVLLMAVAFILPALSRAHESARASSSQNNLKQLGFVFEMYANEHDGFLPPLGLYDGIWMVDLACLYPEYLPDCTILVNPKSENVKPDDLKKLLAASPVDWATCARKTADSYTYLPWLVQSDEDVAAMAAARAALAPEQLQQDLPLPDGTKLPKLRTGIEEGLVSDRTNPAALAMVRARIPVMMETQWHGGKGAYVLFLDNHCEFVAKGTFPCTEAVHQALGLPAE